MVSHTPAEEVELFKDKPLNFLSGTQWEYSNSNYALLGIILEKVTGRRYVDLLQERILAPPRNEGLRARRRRPDLARKS
jgi:CubicO group peptidase (beta-lactamase class C family)